MNKKAVETTIFNVIFGILIAVVLSLILLYLINVFTSEQGPKEESNVYFYFTKLAEDLTKMSIGDTKNLVFLSNKDFILIAFNKEINEIKKTNADKNCMSYYIKDEIKKPIKCRDKNCLCLCKSNLDRTAELYGGNAELTVNCDSDESRCVEFSLEVKIKNTCNESLLYNSEPKEKLYDLELKKEKEFLINPISKTL